MYSKILVALDGSEEAEKVIPIVKNILDRSGEIILLNIIPFFKIWVVDDVTLVRGRHAQIQRFSTMDYLEDLAKGLKTDSVRYRCVVEIWNNAVEGITNFAIREGVNLIAMYTHDRRGFAKLIKGSIAAKVQRMTHIETRVFKPHELVASVNQVMVPSADEA